MNIYKAGSVYVVHYPLVVLPADEPIIIDEIHPIIITSENKIINCYKTLTHKTLGWTASETIGIGMVNPRSISRLTKTNT